MHYSDKSNLFSLIYVAIFLTAFDSLLKFPIMNFNVQIGVLLISCCGFLIKFLRHSNLNFKSKNNDKFPFVFLLILLFYFSFALDLSTYVTLFFYFFMFYVSYAAISEISFGNLKGLSFVILMVIIVTGLVQYLLNNFAGYQITLRGLDESYYLNKGDLAQRMRGLFLEPNWYGLMLFSWFYIYLSSLNKNFTSHSVFIFLLVCVCLFLSGNRLTLFFFFFIFLFYILDNKYKLDNTLIHRYFPFLFVSLSCCFFLYISFNQDFLQDRSSLARTYTAFNSISVLLDSDLKNLIFGYGFSNWGYYSNLLEFSWSNSTSDQPLTRRDNAEFYVFLFEQGLFIIFIFAWDLINCGRKTNSFLDSVFISLMYVSALFYPIYTFMMYLIPLMIVRSRTFI